jgi:hypothetical protein
MQGFSLGGMRRNNQQEKGPLTFVRRPKSREETPKEGMRYRYRTAISWHATHKMQVKECRSLSDGAFRQQRLIKLCAPLKHKDS